MKGDKRWICPAAVELLGELDLPRADLLPVLEPADYRPAADLHWTPLGHPQGGRA